MASDAAAPADAAPPTDAAAYLDDCRRLRAAGWRRVRIGAGREPEWIDPRSGLLLPMADAVGLLGRRERRATAAAAPR
jgi:hypothetical protein